MTTSDLYEYELLRSRTTATTSHQDARTRAVTDHERRRTRRHRMAGRLRSVADRLDA